jgi:hypothetical protein
MAAWRWRLVLCLGAFLAACRGAPPEPELDEQLQQASIALRAGRLEEAIALVDRARQRDPRHVLAAQWSSFIAELSWRDDDAVREQSAAIKNATVAADPAVADQELALRGRLGDLLFRAGRWGECAGPLLAGAKVADGERRRALAAATTLLPFLRKAAGPLVTEQPLLPGDAPEFICGVGDRQRPFAIDTGTSMTTLGSSFADELDVRGRQPAGNAIDGTGRLLPVEVGVLLDFDIGDIHIGSVPVSVVDDQALRLRDFYGGPERVPRGVLGLDLLGFVRLTVDPERQSVTLERARGLPLAQSVQCVRADGRCLVPVSVEGVRLWFVLDTGASHSSLSEAGLQRLPGGESRAVPAFRRVRTVVGGTVSVREVRDLVLRCSEARFVGVALPVVPRGDSASFPVHGVLGVDLLSSCRTTLDLGRARLTALVRPQS